MSKRRFESLSLDEIAAMLEEVLEEDDVETADAVIIPPETDALTDNEDIDDDCTGNVEVDDVAGTLELHVAAQIIDGDGKGKQLEVRAEKSQPPKKKRKLCNSEPTWRNKAPVYTKVHARSNGHEKLLQEMKEKLEGYSPLQVFEEIFSNEIVDLIVKESVRYATEWKNRPSTSLTSDDIKQFIGVLLISGYHKLPAQTQYWSNDEDLGLQIVKSAISKSKLQDIKSILHFCDNNEAENNKNDKGFKVRNLITAAQRSFMKFGIFEKYLAVDEMIVKYYGHHALKQFIRGKPIRFDYKFWALCGVSGYCYNFDLYCGKSSSDDNRADLLLGSKVVLTMLDVVDEPQSHAVFFDNLFTGYELLVHLRDLGYQATGTIRENRLKKCPLMETKEMKKKERGTTCFRFDTNEEILFVRWLDNTCVTIGTNYDTIEPLQKVKRYLKESKTKDAVSQPHVFKNYCQYMGGVDKHDWWISKYATTIRAKKWYWPIFIRILDMAVVNAHIIYNLICEDDEDSATKMDLLSFRRAICRSYLKIPTNKQKPGRKPSCSAPSKVPQDVRFDCKGHIIMRRSDQRRCQNKPCSARPRTYCSKCTVTLCVNCFSSYHKYNALP